MRIVHVNTERGWRGGEIQMRRLALGLSSAGHVQLLVARRGSESAQRMARDPLSLETLPLRSEIDLASAWGLSRLLDAWRADVVHAHTSHAVSLAAMASRLAHRPPVVASRRLDYPLRNPLARLKYSWGADLVVAVAEEVRRVLVEGGVPPDQVRVVHSACDPREFMDLPLREEAREALGLDRSLGLRAGAPLVLTVSALAGHKDLPTLLHAIEILRRERPELRAAILGEGSERPRLEALVQELDLEGIVAMPGHRDDVPLWMAAADLFCLSSRREGIGGVLLEAQAAGLPVVATRVSGLPEAVREGETAFLVPPGEPRALAAAAERLLMDPKGRSRMGEAGRAFVEESFTVDRMVRETAAVYRELVNAWKDRAREAGV